MQEIYLRDKVIVSDPCYEIGTWCQGVLSNVKEGTYQCSYEKCDGMVSSIKVVHTDALKSNLSYTKEEFQVGVDSGQAGIFDYDIYETFHKNEELDKTWYKEICKLTDERVPNPSYIPYNKTLIYEKLIKGFRRELSFLQRKNPSIDIEVPITNIGRFIEGIINPENKFEVSDELVEGNNGCEELKDLTTKYVLRFLKEYEDYRCTRDGVKTVCEGAANIVKNDNGAYGYVSATGYGDGGYECFTARDESGKVVAITIDYGV